MHRVLRSASIQSSSFSPGNSSTLSDPSVSKVVSRLMSTRVFPSSTRALRQAHRTTYFIYYWLCGGGNRMTINLAETSRWSYIRFLSFFKIQWIKERPRAPQQFQKEELVVCPWARARREKRRHQAKINAGWTEGGIEIHFVGERKWRCNFYSYPSVPSSHETDGRPALLKLTDREGTFGPTFNNLAPSSLSDLENPLLKSLWRI